MDSGNCAQEVVVGQEADHDLGPGCDRSQRSQIGPNRAKTTLFDQARVGPGLVMEALLEIVAGEEDQGCIDVDAAQSAARVLGYCRGSCVAIGKDDHGHAQA